MNYKVFNKHTASKQVQIDYFSPLIVVTVISMSTHYPRSIFTDIIKKF